MYVSKCDETFPLIQIENNIVADTQRETYGFSCVKQWIHRGPAPLPATIDVHQEPIPLGPPS